MKGQRQRSTILLHNLPEMASVLRNMDPVRSRMTSEMEQALSPQRASIASKADRDIHMDQLQRQNQGSPYCNVTRTS